MMMTMMMMMIGPTDFGHRDHFDPWFCWCCSSTYIIVMALFVKIVGTYLKNKNSYSSNYKNSII